MASPAKAVKSAATATDNNLPLSPASKVESNIMDTPLHGRVESISSQVKSAVRAFKMDDPSSIVEFTALMDSLALLPEDVRSALLANVVAKKSANPDKTAV